MHIKKTFIKNPRNHIIILIKVYKYRSKTNKVELQKHRQIKPLVIGYV